MIEFLYLQQARRTEVRPTMCNQRIKERPALCNQNIKERPTMCNQRIKERPALCNQRIKIRPAHVIITLICALPLNIFVGRGFSPTSASALQLGNIL